MKQPERTPNKRKPALRLVSTKNMNRDEWLNVRKNGIGASDSAAAIGLNPYQSQLELWMLKTGREHLLPKIDADDEHSPMYWGNLLEPIVAAHYTKRTGNKVRRSNAVLQHPDEDKAWMLANLDYSIVGAADVQILECKTAGEFGARLCTNMKTKKGCPTGQPFFVWFSRLTVTGIYKALAPIPMASSDHCCLDRLTRSRFLRVCSSIRDNPQDEYHFSRNIPDQSNPKPPQQR